MSENEQPIRFERLVIVDETVSFTDEDFERVADIIAKETRESLERDIEELFGIKAPSPYFIGARLIAYDGVLIHLPGCDLLELARVTTQPQPEPSD